MQETRTRSGIPKNWSRENKESGWQIQNEFNKTWL